MKKLSNFDEISDVGYDHPSPSMDHSAPNTPAFSPMSRDSLAYCRAWTSSEASNSNFSEIVDDSSYSSEPSPCRWTAVKASPMKLRKHSLDDKLDDSDLLDSDEFQMMKERFAKLLLGEDMSGGGKGVCTAVTISNAITNLYATVFGQNLKLEPLKPEKKAMWKREMKVLLSVCDYIQEFAPTAQYLEDGTIVEMMKSRPRSDLYINLPALQKLDTMLIEILDTFEDTEFWYAENIPGNSTRSPRAASFRKIVPRKDEKWWLPVPCVLPGGLSDKSRKHLIEKRDCANQIHKAAMAINSNVLAEIDIPETYIDDLPKLTFYCQVIEDSITCDPIKQMSWNFSSNFISLLWKPIIAAETCRKRDDITSYKSGRASLGDSIYHYMNTADKFSPDHLLEFLKISSEHEALDLVDRVESSMYTWRRKACLSHSKSSWKKVKDLMADTDCKDKNYILAERAETLLFCLKQRYPELSQTSLDTTKIQYNRDVGKAVLESYSRVLEGLAFNIVAWVEDVLDVDKSMRNREV
ncbi:rop guanine nucleotide exchange factor 3-like isoform X1 [Lotus japonicus]|uniref:rop guanine nucleotide exchange factor 3-like isoform X1 n=1 Tax=Lotus japonicus TaxID=34305 RepID=UPI0025863328|nr:rop guanine nucleotide exchange factor 3-like isoform X1 [Lotus japonicus]XP_057435643.1 rop guanine nucleotide exchange factor 3-like isoform X1 [Lotus japonicus]